MIIDIEKYFGKKAFHDGETICEDGLVEVYVEGWLDEDEKELVKVHFYDEHFTNHITTKEELYLNEN